MNEGKTRRDLRGEGVQGEDVIRVTEGGVGERRLTGLSEATEELCLLYSTELSPVSVVTGCKDVKREKKKIKPYIL